MSSKTTAIAPRSVRATPMKPKRNIEMRAQTLAPEMELTASPTTSGDKPRMGKTRIEIYCDGSAKGNPGPGGWGFVVLLLEDDGAIAAKEERQCASHFITTNNREEMSGALHGLLFVKDQMASGAWPISPVVVISDSQIVVRGMVEWMPAWLARGWRKSGGKQVENRDLWERILAAADGLHAQWQWVRGHSGDFWNERADVLANQAAEEAERRGVTFAPAAE